MNPSLLAKCEHCRNGIMMLFAILVSLFHGMELQAQSPTFTNLTPANTTAINFYGVCYRDSLNGFITSNKGHILRTRDGGKTWNLQQKIQEGYLSEMYFISPDTAVIVGYGNIIKSNDGGETWYVTQTLPAKDKNGNTYRGLVHVTFINKQVGFAYGQEIIWKTSDGGNTWKEVFLWYDLFYGNIASMHFTDADNGLAFADSISFSTTDGGETWQKKYYASNTNEQFGPCYFFSNLHGYIQIDGQSANFRETFDGGYTWTNVGISGADKNVTFNPFLGFIGLSQSTFWRSVDTGKTWIAKTLSSNYFGVNLNSLSIVTPTHYCIVGDMGQIFDSRDGGNTWSRQSWGYPNGFTRLAFTDSLHGHVCARDGKLLQTSDGGKTWTTTNFAQGTDMANVVFPTQDTGYVLNNGQLYHTYNGGLSWVNSNAKFNIEASNFLDFPSKDVGFMGVSFWGEIFRTFDGGKTVDKQDFFDMGFDYDKLSTGAFYDSNNGIVFSNYGELATTNDGGTTWNRYDIPGQPNFRGCHLFSNNVGVGFSSGIYRTQDGGQTWNVVKTKINSTDYYFPITTNSGIARMGSIDSVYYTNDQGLTWTAQWKGAVNWASISFVNPYLAYCTNADGIYRVDYPRPGVNASTAAPSNITTTTATLNGTVNAQDQSTTAEFEFGTTTNYGTTLTALQSPVTGTTATTVSYALTGLQPNTTYHYRIVGTSPAGITRGADATFTTAIQTCIWDGTAWNPATPTTKDNAVLDGDYNAAGFPCQNLIINPGKQVTIATGTLNVTGNLDIKSGASLIDNGMVAVAGITTVEQYLSGATTANAPSGRFWYISSPLSAATSAGFDPESTNKLWQWNETDQAYTKITDNSTILAPFRGYVARLGANDTIKLSGGELNTGNKTMSLSRTGTATYAGFTLAGNPYPSYLDWESLQENSSDVYPTIWYRSSNKVGTMVFDTYNAVLHEGTSNNGTEVTRYISPMQAFWVLTKESSGTMNATNTMRSHQPGISLKTEDEASDKSLHLMVNNGQNSDETIIAATPSASNDYDDYDSPKLFTTEECVPQIYTIADKRKLVINGMHNIDTGRVIPVYFSTKQAGSFSMKANVIRGFEGYSVLIKDMQLNKTQDLTVNVTYSFTSEAVADEGRFVITLKSKAETTLAGGQANSAVKVYTVNNTIVVEINGTVESGIVARVYDLLGQTKALVSIKGNRTLIPANLTAGTYFVQIQKTGEVTTHKLEITE